MDQQSRPMPAPTQSFCLRPSLEQASIAPPPPLFSYTHRQANMRNLSCMAAIVPVVQPDSYASKLIHFIKSGLGQRFEICGRPVRRKPSRLLLLLFHSLAVESHLNPAIGHSTLRRSWPSGGSNRCTHMPVEACGQQGAAE
ncbi:unnamed protein product [Protopolystoma xenopodis]|uniref:Uncharacterized protein n=1 Tax=Protopolystoma xenopodis TaxID=117903 RepID=A0A448WIT8_9PLAT|nr:unnamed protein product [Protopolystoma xenopodis]